MFYCFDVICSGTVLN